MELPIHEISLVVAALELETTLPCLFAFDEFAGELNLVIIPALGSVAMLLVILPLALIHRPIGVDKYA